MLRLYVPGTITDGVGKNNVVSSGRNSGQRQPDLQRSVETGIGTPEKERRAPGHGPGEARDRERRRYYRRPFAPIRRAVDQSEVLRSGPFGHQVGSTRNGGPLSNRSVIASGFHTDHRDDRPDQRLRHGRY